MTNETVIPQDLAIRKLEDALRLRVGRGRRYSFAGLADATGIKTRTLESYVQGASPSLANLLSLCAVLGPGFTSDLLSVAGQSAKEGTTDDPEHMRMLSVLTGFSHQLAEAVEDGHVDHREAAQLQPVAQRVIDLAEPIARGNRGQGND
ncbi:helix-turn-helix transcriptional regulator [Phaeobacter italicus]|uniref:helix-turn-helix domain-containing protein n=1 Tax=Phaeobacter italicus TaxID=481446 RepID=UPI001ADBFB28|nr:helix-turn-helix transcriptional regulator [Phaeobacter italicus]MBO9441398.1 helix-turn-helix transcriptional regulator [Phaeobacter italicus]